MYSLALATCASVAVALCVGHSVSTATMRRVLSFAVRGGRSQIQQHFAAVGAGDVSVVGIRSSMGDLPIGYQVAMSLIVLLLLIAAAVFFALATFGVAVRRISWIGAGLLCWVLAQLIPALAAL